MHEQSSTKRCNECGSEKLLTDFYRRKSGKIESKCKQCVINRQRQYSQANREQVAVYQKRYREEHGDSKQEYNRAYYEANRDAILEQKREYHEAHKEERACYGKRYREANAESIKARKKEYAEANREKLLAYYKTWRRANLEQVLKASRAHYAANAEALRECARDYAKRNPDVIRANSRNRKARLRGVGGRHTAGDVKRKHEEQGGKCYWCGSDLNGVYHVDHVIPISKGGGNGAGNICCACPPCNLSKGAKMPWEFSDRLL